MKNVLVVLTLSLLSLTAFAQQRITGTVVDKTNSNPLNDVTLQLLNDKDSVLARTRTNAEGLYILEKVPTGQFRLNTSILGYKVGSRSVKIADKELTINYLLEPSEIVLEEIAVTAAPNVAVRGDTLEFNSRNFATREYAEANEMVAQVPGVTIDEEGNVSAHGEQVKRILVDGKEFFSTDPKIALKNLPADIIDKLQIIDERSEQSRFAGFDDGKRNKIINIVTKPDKRKGYFGRANAGKGDSDKFAFSSNVNAFNEDQKIAINLMANNINETNFAEQGYGGQRRGNNNTDRGIADTYAGALNYSNTFLADKMDFNADYNFRRSDAYTNSLTALEYLMQERANQFQDSQTESNVGNINHNFSTRVKWKIDSLNQLDFSPNFTYTENNNHNIGNSIRRIGESELLNTSDRNNTNNTSNFTFGGNMTYMRRLKNPGQTISLNVNGNKSTNDGFGQTLAFNEYYRDALLSRIDTNNRESITNGYGSGINSRLSYTHRLAQYSRLQANYNFRNTRNYSDRKTMEFLAETGQYDELNERLSNEFQNDFNFHSVGASYAYNKRDTLRIQVGLNYEHGMRVNDRTFPIDLRTTADFASLLPEVTAVYYFTKTKNVEFNYNTNTNTPSINDLQDYVDVSNELNIRNGNPNLNQEYIHTAQLRYRDVNRTNGRSFNSNINFSYTNNKIVRSVLITDTTMVLFDDVILGAGGQYSVPVNVDGVYSIRATNSYGLPIKKLGINLNLNSNLFYNKNFAYLNDKLIPSKGYGFSQHVGIFTNFSKNIIIGMNYNANVNFTNNPTARIQNYTVQTHRVSNTLTLEFLKRMAFSYNLAYLYNSGIGGSEGISTTLLNASLGYKVFKQKNAELSLKAFDLLNNASSIRRTASETAISSVTSNTLNRYFLLSFTYNLRNFGGKMIFGDDEGGRGDRPRGNRRGRN
ncbi:MAG: outer membrane beta-barrel protein [Sphingobacterium hotanense]